MWSPFHHYLNIYKDKALSESVETTRLREFLATLPGLEQIDPFHFTADSLHMSLLFASSESAWSSDEVSHLHTNLIVIVCAKEGHMKKPKHLSLLIQIASFLGWQLVDEHTDDEIENAVLWPLPN